MSLHQITARPKRPTSAEVGSITSVDLPGYELWLTYIKNVHVVPVAVDVLRFAGALSKALQCYPHAAGRLQQLEEGSWSILLTNSSVPISIDRKAEDVAGPEDSRVIQDDVKKYLPSTGANPVNTDSPLVLFKLSIANTETAIGVSWHHTLGDATVLLRFMLILSLTYHELPGDLESIPTFTKYHFLSPSQDVVEQYLPLMPHLSRTYELAALAARYAEMNVNICRVDARITEEKLGHLRDKLVEAAGGTINLSRQDCLSAYIANVLGRCLGMPIRTITNAASYRNLPVSCVEEAVAGNAIYITPAYIPDDDNSLITTAIALRAAIDHYKKPDILEQYMSVASDQMLSAANSGRLMFFASPPGSMSVNSNLSLDWQSVHFGYPEQARFHTSGINDRYLRVFRANLTRMDNGRWASSGKAVDICFAVPSWAKSTVETTLAAELGAPDFPDTIMLAK